MKAIYVVYFTTYSGALLPPFYIGSTSMARITKGYHGSVTSAKYATLWKSEIKHHPELFQTRIVSEHETRSEALLEEQRLHLELDVVNHPLFINQAIAGLHPRNSGKGRKMSDKTKDALQASRLGSHHTEETKAKMRKSHEKRQPISESTREKLSNAAKNSHAANPRAHTQETKEKIRAAAKSRPPISDETRLKRSESMKETLRRKRQG